MDGILKKDYYIKCDECKKENNFFDIEDSHKSKETCTNLSSSKDITKKVDECLQKINMYLQEVKNNANDSDSLEQNQIQQVEEKLEDVKNSFQNKLSWIKESLSFPLPSNNDDDIVVPSKEDITKKVERVIEEINLYLSDVKNNSNNSDPLELKEIERIEKNFENIKNNFQIKLIWINNL